MQYRFDWKKFDAVVGLGVQGRKRGRYETQRLSYDALVLPWLSYCALFSDPGRWKTAVNLRASELVQEFNELFSSAGRYYA